MITKYNEYIKESLSTKNDIKDLLDSMKIRNYTINDDLTVDIDRSIELTCRDLTKIPIKFNKINGFFNCSSNNLTSLEGCPNIVNGSFFCSNNKLISLKGCPTNIYGDFYCFNNPNLVDINDLDSKILIKNINRIDVSQEVFDKYFEYWIGKDFNIFNTLKNIISDNIKQKYSHLFNANNFDLI